MNNIYYSISSSEDDSKSSNRDSYEIVSSKKWEEKSPPQSDKNILFSEDITSDDEIWLVQSPTDINTNSFSDASIDFDSEMSKTKLRSHKKRKKRYNVYAMKNLSSQVNCFLPEKSTQSFKMHIMSLTGKIILQENIKIRNKIKVKDLQCNTVSQNAFKTDVEDFSQITKNEISDVKLMDYQGNEASFKKEKKKRRF